MDQSLQKVKQLAELAEFAALIAVCSIFVIPIGPVPITLQTMVIALTGMFLGVKRGMLAVMLYIFAGCLGMPVFAGGKAGIGVLLGPTGGYLLGFIAKAGICGLVSANQRTWHIIILLLIGLVVAHAAGIIGLCLSLGRTPYQAMLIDAAFIPGDLLKTAAAFLLWRVITKCRNKHA
ncbi:MAG: biotin transporter BioY [Mailhella sp.]|nr:biotin transporter BioY [Mailhella sp.]